ncbi:TAXI family TRAP transporter solute-binding subunit [Reichenbachiella sp. MSK19-1]|uniref:TAXI family TRAP transporter solute-binding subunit n=1 Tax=Reichenbachiella sp. MSK19-1 TaxID=1897631 RepID=UPI000E6D1326|nr:TAXI family TRAP transporter solute-binding subunit [Reichenbachiella sp. MSK19-1]RJE73894.1 hypothetical protein BGP76_11800 [Reichenbachiella sp. MSK19-1]
MSHVRFHVLVLLFLPVFLQSCFEADKYKLAALSPETTYYKNGLAIQSVLSQSNIEVDLIDDNSLGSLENCKLLQSAAADFAIAQNDVEITHFMNSGISIKDINIRTVLPLYPEVLLVIHPDSINPKSIEELVVGKRIGVGPKNSGTSIFFKNLLAHNQIPEDAYTIVNTPWSENVVSNKIDVSVVMSGLFSNFIREQLKKDVALFSFSNINNYGKGSEVEGFVLNYVTSRPYVIPKNVFGLQPVNPVVTYAIDAVLLCRADIDAYTIQSVVEELVTQRKILADHDPLLNGITDDFKNSSINFPLHEGTQLFLDRNNPSFFEKYAEVIGVVFSILVAFYGLSSTLVRIKRKKKLDRIEEFYTQLLELENQTDFSSLSSIETGLNTAKELRRKAVHLLTKERLEANESFNIFIHLHDTLVDKFYHNKKNLQVKNS